MLHSGIDLHKRDLVIATVDGDGRHVREARLPTTRAAVASYFAGFPGRHRAVVESTSNCFPSARDFVSYCRLVPGAGNSGGKTRHKRSKDGNRYLKLIFTHMAVRAIQYYPEISAFYQRTARRQKRGDAIFGEQR